MLFQNKNRHPYGGYDVSGFYKIPEELEPRSSYYCFFCEQWVFNEYPFGHNCKNKSNESADHYHAKYRATRLLSLLSNFIVEVRCRQCDEIIDSCDIKSKINEFAKMGYKVIPFVEQNVDGKKFDVLIGECKNGIIPTPFYAIEILNTHARKEGDLHKNLNWCELKTDDVLKFWSADETSRTFLCRRGGRYCKDCNARKRTIQILQRGAGSGKTYEIVDMMEKLVEKTVFIYSSKTHAQVFNIKSEINKRYGDDSPWISSGKIIKRKIKIGDREVDITLRTIDSYIYAEKYSSDRNGKRDYRTGDTFIENVREVIGADYFDKLKSGYDFQDQDTNMAVFIDESQDLGVCFLEAFQKICSKNKVDFYLVGDKLQSIYNPINMIAHTIDEGQKEDIGCSVILNIGENVIRRFENKNLVELVNSMIDFGKYGLKEMQPYQGHDSDHGAICLIKHGIIASKNNEGIHANKKEINKTCKEMIRIIKELVEKHSYKPEDFLVVSSFVKDNFLLNDLQMRINEFWSKRNNQGGIFCTLHKSEVGQPINLDQSVNHTRIMSIHGSKGLGCPVVFVVGMSQHNLEAYGPVEGLIYESLLHVAITRAKNYLYILNDGTKDDIHKRLSKTCLKNDLVDDSDDYDDYEMRSSFQRTIAFWESITSDEKFYNTNVINDDLDEVSKYFDRVKRPDSQNRDMNDHIDRYLLSLAIVETTIFSIIYKLSMNDEKKPTTAILCKIRNADIKICGNKEYMLSLKYNWNVCKSNSGDKFIIPILKYWNDDVMEVYKCIVDMQRFLKEKFSNMENFSLEQNGCLHYARICLEGQYSITKFNSDNLRKYLEDVKKKDKFTCCTSNIKDLITQSINCGKKQPLIQHSVYMYLKDIKILHRRYSYIIENEKTVEIIKIQYGFSSVQLEETFYEFFLDCIILSNCTVEKVKKNPDKNTHEKRNNEDRFHDKIYCMYNVDASSDKVYKFSIKIVNSKPEVPIKIRGEQSGKIVECEIRLEKSKAVEILRKGLPGLPDIARHLVAYFAHLVGSLSLDDDSSKAKLAENAHQDIRDYFNKIEGIREDSKQAKDKYYSKRLQIIDDKSKGDQIKILDTKVEKIIKKFEKKKRESCEKFAQKITKEFDDYLIECVDRLQKCNS